MCLVTLDKETQEGTGVGWKYFRSDASSHLEFAYYGGRVNYNTWLKDKAKGMIPKQCGGFSYHKGYHVYVNKEDAVFAAFGEQIRRVEYREVVASGRQDGRQVVVARQILIHKKGE